MSQIEVSVVIPLKNEQGNVTPLLNEIESALEGKYIFEVIAINDASTDNTLSVLKNIAKEKSWLRIRSHKTSCGQSVAIRSGIKISHAPIIATLDGDGQNNPQFLPEMIALLQKGGEPLGLVQGERQGRQDTEFKKFQSRVANKVRGTILNDDTRDTGCGLKVFRKKAYDDLPFFSAIHRFMPALVKGAGYQIACFPVVDRPRLSGVSNYGFFDRLWVGVLDLFGVWWLLRRKGRKPEYME